QAIRVATSVAIGLRVELGERRERVAEVRVDAEERVEVRDPEARHDAPLRRGEDDLAAGRLEALERGHECADARRVQIVERLEVEDEGAPSLLRDPIDAGAEGVGGLADLESPFDPEDRVALPQLLRKPHGPDLTRMPARAIPVSPDRTRPSNLATAPNRPARRTSISSDSPASGGRSNRNPSTPARNPRRVSSAPPGWRRRADCAIASPKRSGANTPRPLPARR